MSCGDESHSWFIAAPFFVLAGGIGMHVRHVRIAFSYMFASYAFSMEAVAPVKLAIFCLFWSFRTSLSHHKASRSFMDLLLGGGNCICLLCGGRAQRNAPTLLDLAPTQTCCLLDLGIFLFGYDAEHVMQIWTSFDCRPGALNKNPAQMSWSLLCNATCTCVSATSVDSRSQSSVGRQLVSICKTSNVAGFCNEH